MHQEPAEVIAARMHAVQAFEVWRELIWQQVGFLQVMVAGFRKGKLQLNTKDLECVSSDMLKHPSVVSASAELMAKVCLRGRWKWTASLCGLLLAFTMCVVL